MRLLAPHIRRAVLISKVLDVKQGESDMLAQTVNGLRTAVILAGADGRIVYANASAHLLLSEGDILRAVGGRLMASAPQADESLHEVFPAAATGDKAIGTRGIALPLIAKTGERYAAHVLPLTSGGREQMGRTHAATAAVFVHKAILETASAPVIIAETYKLTMAELRVFLAIVEVGGVPEVAEMLGVAASTVRTHLLRIFEKTGATRQADLVKLAASFANPLLP
jgi:DNA-binding CsgD family transcriptional regulator